MLTDKLERLVDAHEARGVPVRESLAPGVSAAELDALAERVGFDLPDDYRALYEWHNGGPLLLFRDNSFCEIGNPDAQRTLDIYSEIGEEDGLDDLPVDLRRCLPIAEFNGAVYVVPGKGLSQSPLSPNPVVSVFEGIDVYYLSIETMVDTCIEWVEQHDWTPTSEAPNEMRIWMKHNPACFPDH